MENTNQNQTGINPPHMPVAPVAKPAMAAPQVAQTKPKSKGLKYLLIAVAVLAAGVIGYFGYTNPQLFRAAVIESAVQPTVPPTTYLYIPAYDASPQDSGNIAIKTNNIGSPPLFTEDIVSMQFRLKWSPVDAMTLNTNSIVFDNDTLFKSADLKGVNTSTPGQAVISFFSNTGKTITLNDQTVLKLAVAVNGVAGSSISLLVDNVEVIIKDGSNYLASTNFTSIAADKINLVSQANLRVLNAEALDDTHVLVRFSDLLKRVGGATDYDFAGKLDVMWPVSGYGDPTFTGYDQSTVILTTKTQVAGKPYALEVKNNDVQSNTKGTLDDNYRKAFFEGYKSLDGVTNSLVKLQSIDVKSSTELVLNFSGGLKTDTVTPINIIIKDGSASELTVTKAEMGASNTVNLTTASQTPDKNYFIKFSGLLDANNLPILNNRELNFFGYTVPSLNIINLNPSTVINNVDQVIVVAGQNLDTVSSIRVGTTNVVISNQTAGALNFTVPKDFTAGIYDVTFTNTVNETKTLEKALVVSTPATPMHIVSEQSKSIPYRVKPDGTTRVTFWVLVEDPVAIANVDSVTMDLQQIGGSRTQEMAKDPGLQQRNTQFYTYTTTVSANTPTSKDPYKLPVEVKKGGEVAHGTVDILVTNEVLQGVKPTVDQVYISPSTVPPDGKTKVKISAKVSDQDGADTIASVVADLGPIGAGFVSLTKLDVAGAANQQVTGWFESPEFTIPTNTKEGSYNVAVTASDGTGGTGTGNLTVVVSSSATGPRIDTARSYLSPRKSVPRDNKTTFAINAMITDPDGVSDIDSVNAYFGTLGLRPAALLRDPNASDAAKTALYSSQDLVIPTEAPIGVSEIQIVATDKNGATATLILQLDVTTKDTLGDAPIIFSAKSYTMPRVAINDGQTFITLYAFVRDDDNNLDTVVVNLGNIGQVGPESIGDLGLPNNTPVAVTDTGTCSTNSTTFVCMQPSFKEGSEGQWYILPNVTISKNTLPSSSPYKVEVIATDTTDKVSRGEIPVFVSSSTGYAAEKNPPEVVVAVPTAPGKVEVVFNKELSALTLSSSGSDFTITDKNNVNSKLNVIGATINSTGNIVTLTTDSQTEGKEYVLNASTKITDQAGMPLVSGQPSRANFKGFTASAKQPVIYYVSAVGLDTIDVGFQENLRPSSVKVGSDLSDYNFKVYESENSANILKIKSVQFIDNGSTIEIVTDGMKSDTKYILQVSDIASSGGTELKSPIAKIFRSIKISAIRQAQVQNQADLNGDGKVDFIDFTMFSAVYGQVFDNTNSASGPSAIPSQPESIVPHTSVPAGGAIQ